jgi:hypothetical protein
MPSAHRVRVSLLVFFLPRDRKEGRAPWIDAVRCWVQLLGTIIRRKVPWADGTMMCSGMEAYCFYSS